MATSFWFLLQLSVLPTEYFITEGVGNTELPSRNTTHHSYFDGKATVYMCKRKQYESAASKKKKKTVPLSFFGGSFVCRWVHLCGYIA